MTAFRIARRDLSASPSRFAFVVLAVAVGVAALTGVKGFGAAFQSMLLSNARQLIAADLQAQTWLDPTPLQLKQIEALGARYGRLTRVSETVSMARAKGAAVPQMVSVKGIDPAEYPYYGKLQFETNGNLQQLLATDDGVVVSPELSSRLHVRTGGELRLGGRNFRVAAILTAEPDRLASGFGPGMRILMSRHALESTGLLQFGSRAAQRFLFRLRAGASVEQLREQVKQVLPRVFITDYREGSPAVGQAIQNTTTFLSLISLIALVIGALGVAVAMHSHLQQRMDSIAVMKALGARSSQVMAIYLMETAMVAGLGGTAGVMIGLIVQRSFPLLMAQIFHQLPAVPWNWSFSAQGLMVGMLAALLFTLPPLMGVRDIRPNLVFRRYMQEPVGRGPQRWQMSALLLVIAAGFLAMAAWLSGSWRMGFYFALGLGTSVLLLLAISAGLLWIMRRAVAALGTRISAASRHGLANLYRPGSQSRSVLVALGVGVMFTATTYLLQKTVLDRVEGDGPGREGNVFLLDVRDTSGLRRLLAQQPGVAGKLELTGYIVSRLLDKNGIPAEALPLPKQTRDRLQVLRVNTADGLPDSVEVNRGRWWPTGANEPQIAVSEQATRDYGVHLGDRLRFQMAGHEIVAPVVAVFKRTRHSAVRFDLLFPRISLRGLPVVYFGAVHVADAAIPAVEQKIFEAYPTVTVMNLADVLARIQEAVDQVGVVVRFLAGFAIVAGVVILSSSVAGTRYRRIREVAVFKALGGTKAHLRHIFSVEFTVMGLTAGLTGGALATLFTGAIAVRFLQAEFQADWVTIVVAMVGSAVLANVAGWLASLRILDQRPIEALRTE